MINITDVRVTLSRNRRGKLKAVASLVIDDCFAVHDIKIIEGAGGTFVAMPAVEITGGRFRDIAHPLDAETRHSLTRRILAEYRKLLCGKGDGEK